MSEPLPSSPTAALSTAARVVLRVGCILIESGITARRTQEAIRKAALGFSCAKIEMLCGPDMIAVELRRGEERATELRRVRSQRVNMQLAYATLEVVDRIAKEGLTPETVQTEFDALRAAPPEHPHWLICLAAGLSCAAFGQLLGTDPVAFVPTLAASSAGQWLRLRFARAQMNVFLSTAVVSFAAAALAGFGGMLAGSHKAELASVSAVLLLIPGLSALTALKDIIDGHMNLGTSRAVHALTIVFFIGVGLLVAQRLLFSSK
jgi:uncharacterized membrane protein YjjP (DUF1212 family)